MLPIFKPMIDRRNVVAPIIATADHISTARTANETPTASASMLVATAIISMVCAEKSGSGLTFSREKDSRIMFIPINPSRKKAIQWSMDETKFENVTPRKNPISGISA